MLLFKRISKSEMRISSSRYFLYLSSELNQLLIWPTVSCTSVVQQLLKAHHIVLAVEVCVLGIRVRNLLHILRSCSVPLLFAWLCLASQLSNITVVGLLCPSLLVFVVLRLFVQELHEGYGVNY